MIFWLWRVSAVQTESSTVECRDYEEVNCSLCLPWMFVVFPVLFWRPVSLRFSCLHFLSVFLCWLPSPVSRYVSLLKSCDALCSGRFVSVVTVCRVFISRPVFVPVLTLRPCPGIEAVFTVLGVALSSSSVFLVRLLHSLGFSLFFFLSLFL